MKYISVFIGTLCVISLFGCSKSAVPTSEPELNSQTEVPNTLLETGVENQNTSLNAMVSPESSNAERADKETKAVDSDQQVEHVKRYNFKGFVKSAPADAHWSNLKIHVLNTCEEEDDPSRVTKELKSILQSWYTSQTAHNAKALALRFGDTVYLRGAVMDNQNFYKMMKSTFEKSKDYKLTPEAEVYANCISQAPDEPVENWTVRFNASTVEDGHVSQNETMLGLTRYFTDDDDATWKFIMLSDLTTDRNLMRQLGIQQTKEDNGPCEDLLGYIVTESPVFRWDILMNYQAFTDDHRKMNYELDDGDGSYHLYENQGSNLSSIDWFEVNRNTKTIKTVSDKLVVIDKQYEQMIDELCKRTIDVED